MAKSSWDWDSYSIKKMIVLFALAMAAIPIGNLAITELTSYSGTDSNVNTLVATVLPIVAIIMFIMIILEYSRKKHIKGI